MLGNADAAATTQIVEAARRGSQLIAHVSVDAARRRFGERRLRQIPRTRECGAINPCGTL
jgi:hypothetical protein